MRNIRVGLAGYGVGGAVFHAPLIGAVEGLSLAAVATSRREAVAATWPEAAVVPSADALAADPGIDLIAISTPTSNHFAAARRALEAGKHVVVDKPFTVTVAEADELIDLARRQGLLLTVYQNRRWDGDFRTVEQLVRSGTLGTIYEYAAHFDRFRPQRKGGWRDEDLPGSGILYDLGSHLADQALHLFGLPDTVWADAFCQRPEASSTDYFHLALGYGRCRAILHGGCVVREPGPHFAVHGDGGSFLKYGMDPQEEALRGGAHPAGSAWGADAPEHYGCLVRADGTRERVATAHGDYTEFYRGVARALREGAPPPVDPRDSRNGLVLIEAAIESARDGRRVTPRF